MNLKNLISTYENGIATVTINRPKVLNALNKDTLLEIKEVFTKLGTDDKVKVIILTGSGEKAFVAGADIAFMQSLSAIEGFEFAKLGQEAFMTIEGCPKPVIAAINGFALGGGNEIAMACDLRIAAETARFGQPEINLGIIPGFAGTQRLTRLVGKTKAKEIIYTGAMIEAQEAHRIGLVNKVVPLVDLMDEALKMAELIASKGAVSLKLAKSAIDTGVEIDFHSGSLHEAQLFGLCFSTEDQKEGMSAFLEKRKAKFKNK
ncbi:MAG: enoyl-CoA hydratase [Clostridia bacterium]|nr:enoyl-CoA hydratase [Clostridia bacterium]